MKLEDYLRRKDTDKFESKSDYYANPDKYISTFHTEVNKEIEFRGMFVYSIGNPNFVICFLFADLSIHDNVDSWFILGCKISKATYNRTPSINPSRFEQ